MARSRLYRDYMSDDESLHALPERQSSHKRMERAETPRTIVPANLKQYDESNEDDSYSLNSSGYGTGIAQTTDEITRYSAEEESIGTPHTEIRDNLFPPTVPADFAPARANAVAADIERKRALSPYATSLSNMSQGGQSADGGSTGSRMPEFFGQTIFQTALQNPTIAHQLLKFGQSRLCGENLEFLARVNRYHGLLQEVSKSIAEIHKEFLSTSAPNQINLTDELLRKVTEDAKSALTQSVPSLEAVFTVAQNDIERLVYTDIYPRFVKHQMSISAAKALGGDRSKYAGLGDCFVLTDPSKADNPIMYASDGFVNVTGYNRNEIIPRNCRFLQSRYTSRAAVRRLRLAIEKREESVELLLNQKKNGEPFWNLLYTTPLFDLQGNLVFFLGGQINCSTTIHSTSDVLKILAQSKEVEDSLASKNLAPEPPKPTRSKILGVFRSNSSHSADQRVPGMENTLLDQMGEMPLKNQMSTFYNAYSHYIIINYSTFLVTFVSSGIVDMLFPIKAKPAFQSQGVGTDIFKFLANYGTGSVSWETKSSVKGALKAGRPISIDLKLCARPYMGFVKFVTHWTPVKDENGAVVWVVLTLGNDRR